MPAQQAKYYILTVPKAEWNPPTEVVDPIAWLYGQAECGDGGYEHWQFIAYFKKKVTLTKAKSFFPSTSHLEPARSSAVETYVRKEETRIAGTEFEVGSKALKRNSDTDWETVWESAKAGRMMDIPADVRIRCYGTLKNIHKDFAMPITRDIQEVNVYWGVTGSGKTHRVFQEVGETYYIKASTTKWFDGYSGQENIVMDEFCGVVDIVHMLKWLDRYPCSVEVKGSQVYLNTKKWWITSNIDPKNWYNKDGVTNEQRAALRRRLTNVVEFTNAYRDMTEQHIEAADQTNFEYGQWDWLDSIIN